MVWWYVRQWNVGRRKILPVAKVPALEQTCRNTSNCEHVTFDTPLSPTTPQFGLDAAQRGHGTHGLSNSKISSHFAGGHDSWFASVLIGVYRSVWVESVEKNDNNQYLHHLSLHFVVLSTPDYLTVVDYLWWSPQTVIIGYWNDNPLK